MTEKKQLNRRQFLLAARSPSVDFGVYEASSEAVPIPPAHAQVHTTACDYCIVGCGYKASPIKVQKYNIYNQ